MSYLYKTYVFCLLQVVLILNLASSETHALAFLSDKTIKDNDVAIDEISFYSEEASGLSITIPVASAFTPYTQPLKSGNYWIKIDILNSGLYSRRVLLQFPSSIVQLTSIQATAAGDTLIQQSGFHLSPDKKKYVLKYENVIEAEVISNARNSIYLQIEIPETAELDISPFIHEISEFRDRLDVYRNIAIIFSAIFFILGLYNFILHFILDEKGFLFYAMMVLGFALLASIPLLFHVFKAPIVITLSILAASFIVFSGAHFAVHFLKAPPDQLWNKLLRGLATINISLVILLLGKLVFFGSSVIFNGTASLIAAISALVLIILWIGTASSVWKSRDIRGRYFLLINVPILLGALLFTLIWLMARYQNLPIPFDMAAMVTIIFYSGTVIQLVAFSLVFGYHIKGLEYEKLEIQTKLNKELEGKVEERTNNLQKANAKIGEQKDALEKLNDLKDKLFTIISHDLRSPLTSLQGMLGLFSARTLPKEEVTLFVNKINNTLSHTTAVLDNLLHWSKSQMTGIQLNKSKFYINDLIEKNFELMLPLIEDKNIEVNKELFSQEVDADENMINIVIRNLLSNAIKFTRVGGRIDVKMTSEGEFLYISVKDNGLGMNKEQLSNLFQVRNHHSSVGTLNEKGTGLGLILSHEFIQHNGGEIKVTSEQKKGSVFVFSLPLQYQS